MTMATVTKDLFDNVGRPQDQTTVAMATKNVFDNVGEQDSTTVLMIIEGFL